MKFLTGAVLGLAVGYYLGTRDDHDRYEQIRGAAEQIAATEPVRNALEATEPHRTAARSMLSGSLKLTSRGLRAASRVGATNGNRR